MRGANAEYLIHEASKSGELAAAIDLVAETSVHGHRKFAANVSRDLARTVVCRAYAPALRELVHLVVAAEAFEPRPGRYEGLFWSTGTARPSSFRAFVESRLMARADSCGYIAMTSAGITITYHDGTFAISFARMPFLSAAMEFLVAVIGYAQLDDLWNELFRAGPSFDRVAATADQVSKLVYQYLKIHLTAAQEQRNFNCLVVFLRQRGAGDFGPEDITDSAILDFWLTEEGQEGSSDSDFKTFASVFRVFLRFRQALESARELSALKTARAIGPDRQADEIDPATIVAGVEIVDEPVDILAALPNESVKFLTKREKAELAALLGCGNLAAKLLLSFLRFEVFAPTQSRITQGFRRRSGKPEIRALIDGAEQASYESRISQFKDVDRQLAKILGAALYALLRARRAEAFEIILALYPGIDVGILADWLSQRSDGETVVHLKDKFLDRIFLALENPETINDEIAAVVRDARRDFHATSRKGFDNDALNDPEIVGALAGGVGSLIRIRQRLEDLFFDFAATRPPRGDWRAQFTVDDETFRGHFCLLYGVPR